MTRGIADSRLPPPYRPRPSQSLKPKPIDQRPPQPSPETAPKELQQK